MSMMIPKIEKVIENEDILTFQLSNINVSLSNAVRRIILSEIPTWVFKTTPHEQNKAIFYENTTRLNNEILKQRLSCIPIHVTDLDLDTSTSTSMKDYILEVNVENTSNIIKIVTTEDFKIKDVKTDKYMDEKASKQIFPANQKTGQYIDFCRLRPAISQDIPGEKLHFTCEFSIGTAKENGMYNVVSTCSYGNTLDDTRIKEELEIHQQKWKDEDKDIEFESQNWKLLEGLRFFKKDSFDFIVQTVGVFQNEDIVKKACSILMDKLKFMDGIIDAHELPIVRSQNTMSNCFDIILQNEDYTVGKIIEYLLYVKYFEKEKSIAFCGFKKMHPHDADSIIRIAYKEEQKDKTLISQHLKSCIADALQVYQKISEAF